MRILRAVALLLVVCLGGVWVWAWVARSPGQALSAAFAERIGGLFGADMPIPGLGGGMVLPAGMTIGGGFELVAESGRPVSEADFRGEWLLIYFGYTYCPDVCPTELGAAAAAVDLLGPQGDRVVPVLITIDPERDTPAHLADYVARFHPRLRGLTGTNEQIAAVARRYRVYFARTRSDNTTDYLMDHSSFLYLVAPDGRVRALFRPQTAPEAIATTIAAHLRAG
jgi:protein SCO1